MKKYFLLLVSFCFVQIEADPSFNVSIFWQMPVDCYGNNVGKLEDLSTFWQYMFSTQNPTSMNDSYGKLEYDYYQLTGQAAPGNKKGSGNENNPTTVFQNKNYFNQYVTGPYFTGGYNTSSFYITKPQYPASTSSFSVATLRAAFLGLYQGSSQETYSNMQNTIEALHWCLVGVSAKKHKSSSSSDDQEEVFDDPLSSIESSQNSGIRFVRARHIYNSSVKPPSLKTAASSTTCNDIMTQLFGNTATGSFSSAFQTAENVFKSQALLSLNSFASVQGVKMTPMVYFGDSIALRIHLITPGRQIKLNGKTTLQDIVECQNTYTDMIQEVDSNGWGF